MSNNKVNELCDGFLCSPEGGKCFNHSANVSLIEGRTWEDIVEPPEGSVVLVDGVALQSGLIPDCEGWAYFYDNQPQYAEWKDVATRAVLIYLANDDWQEGMPSN